MKGNENGDMWIGLVPNSIKITQRFITTCNSDSLKKCSELIISYVVHLWPRHATTTSRLRTLYNMGMRERAGSRCSSPYTCVRRRSSLQPQLLFRQQMRSFSSMLACSTFLGYDMRESDASERIMVKIRRTCCKITFWHKMGYKARCFRKTGHFMTSP